MNSSAALPVLVFGTGNHKKAAELVELLAPSGIQLKTLADFAAPLEVEETGATFAENARLKAAEQAKHLHQWVLADDSGLVVDALGGQPGVFSARYAGPDATDADNRRKLLSELANVPYERRTAHFVCHLTLADPHGAIRAEATGKCHGTIRTAEAGSGGFGYDPLFEVVEYHRTFGELGPITKAVLSHRARAMFAILPELVRALSESESSSG
jgi:XTP/dITP diphosphohydrolase